MAATATELTVLPVRGEGGGDPPGINGSLMRPRIKERRGVVGFVDDMTMDVLPRAFSAAAIGASRAAVADADAVVVAVGGDGVNCCCCWCCLSSS